MDLIMFLHSLAPPKFVISTEDHPGHTCWPYCPLDLLSDEIKVRSQVGAGAGQEKL